MCQGKRGGRIIRKMKKATSSSNSNKPVLKATSRNTASSNIISTSFTKPTASSSAKNVSSSFVVDAPKKKVAAGQENSIKSRREQVDVVPPSPSSFLSTSAVSDTSISSTTTTTSSANTTSCFGRLDRYEFSDDHLAVETDFSSRKLVSATIGGVEYKTTAAGGNNEIGVGAFSKIYKAAPTASKKNILSEDDANLSNNSNSTTSSMIALRVTTSDLTSRLERELTIHEFLLGKQLDEKIGHKFDGIVHVYGGGLLSTTSVSGNGNNNNNNTALKTNSQQDPHSKRMYSAIQAMELLHPETLYDFCKTYPFNYSSTSNNSNNNVMTHDHNNSNTTVVDLYELMLECATPIAALHDVGIMHRDIKPSNFIFANNGTIKLIDFGIACSTDEHLPPAELCVGSPAFCAPEVAANFLRVATSAQEREQVTSALDVYSLGVVFYVMLEGCSGATPYQDEHRPLDKRIPGERPLHELAGTQRTVRILQRVRDGEWYWSAKFRQRMSLLEAKKKSSMANGNNTSKSPSLAAIFPMVTLLEMKSLVESMMALDPKKRISAQDVCAQLRKMIATEEEAFEIHQQAQAQKQERKLARMTASPSINNNSQDSLLDSDDNFGLVGSLTNMPSISTSMMRQTFNNNNNNNSSLLSRATVLMNNSNNGSQQPLLRSRARRHFFNLVTSPQSPFLNRRTKKRQDDEDDMFGKSNNNNSNNNSQNNQYDDIPPPPAAAVALATGNNSFTRYDNDNDDESDNNNKEIVVSMVAAPKVQEQNQLETLKQDEANNNNNIAIQQICNLPLTKAASAKIQREFAASHKKLLAEEHEAWELLVWLHENQAKQAKHAHSFRKKILKVDDASEGFYCDLCMKKCSPPTTPAELAIQQQKQQQFCSMHCSCDMDVCMDCYESYVARRTCECCNKKFSWLKDIQNHECAGRKSERLSTLLLANSDKNKNSKDGDDTNNHDDSRRRERGGEEENNNSNSILVQEDSSAVTKKSAGGRKSAKIVGFVVEKSETQNSDNANNDLIQEEDGVTYEGLGPKKPLNRAAPEGKKIKTATISAPNVLALQQTEQQQQQLSLPVQPDLPIPTRKSLAKASQQNIDNADDDAPFTTLAPVSKSERTRSRSRSKAPQQQQQEQDKLPLFWVRRCRFVSAHDSPRIADCFFYICQPGRHGAMFTSTAFPFHSVICSIPEGIAWIIYKKNKSQHDSSSTTYTVDKFKVSDIRSKYHRSDPYCRAVDTITELAVEDNNFLKARRSVQNEVVSIAATNSIPAAVDGQLLSRVADYPLVFVEDFHVDTTCETGVTVLQLSDGRRQTIGGKPNVPRFELHGYRIEVEASDEQQQQPNEDSAPVALPPSKRIVNIVELFDEANATSSGANRKSSFNHNNKFGLNGIQLFDPSTISSNATNKTTSNKKGNDSRAGSMSGANQTSFEKELAEIAKQLGFQF